MHFLAELRAYLAGLAGDLLREHSFGKLLKVEVAQDIAADAAREQGRAERLAYTAEQADREAARLLRESLADGRITAAEIPLLRTALRHVTRSADTDRKLTGLLTT